MSGGLGFVRSVATAWPVWPSVRVCRGGGRGLDIGRNFRETYGHRETRQCDRHTRILPAPLANNRSVLIEFREYTAIVSCCISRELFGKRA